MFNISGTAKVDFRRIMIPFSVSAKENENSKTYEKLLFKGNLDLCKLSKGIFTNFIVKELTKVIMDHSNVRSIDCPFRKGFYYAVNVPIGSKSGPGTEQYLPFHLISVKSEFEVLVTVKAKVSKSSPLVNIFSLKVYGAYNP